MTRFLLLTPLALAACGSIPCPVPVSCIEPDWCVCITTGTPAAMSEDGGGFAVSIPDDGPTVDGHGPGNSGGTKDDSNGHGSSDGSNSSEGGKSDE